MGKRNDYLCILGKAQDGNAILELTLFIPLLLIILISGLEASLAASERSAISTAVRSGLNEQRAVRVSVSQMEEHESNGLDFRLKESASEELLERTATAIERELLKVRGRAGAANNPSYRIQASLVEMDLDRASGNSRCRISTSVQRGNGSFHPLSRDIGSEYIDAEEYIGAVCNSARFAAAAPSAYISLIGEGEKLRHQSRSYRIYAEVDASILGVNRTLSAYLLGRNYVVREQGMTVLRLAGGQR